MTDRGANRPPRDPWRFEDRVLYIRQLGNAHFCASQLIP